MITINTLTAGGAVYVKLVADRWVAFGPVMQSRDEALKFLSWLDQRGENAATDFTDTGLCFRYSLFREEVAAQVEKQAEHLMLRT